ncbi:hypothetical protein PTKIN_Ptkin14bG0010900 [Pterospermum kingtungense]
MEYMFLKNCKPFRSAITINAAPKNFKAFDSRKEVFEALQDSTISMIGVYGAGPVEALGLLIGTLEPSMKLQKHMKQNMFVFTASTI